MIKNCYEYKDKQDWYIGKWGEGDLVSLTSFEYGPLYERAMNIVYQLFEQLEINTLKIHVVHLTSLSSFLHFVIQLINEQEGRQLSLVQHQGSLLVMENEQLMVVSLPKEGVSSTIFFGQEATQNSQPKVGDTILIATKNEGKTAEFRHFFETLGYQVENLTAYPDLPDVVETGVTFEENARLKAETIASLTGKMVLADDSGLKVDKLGGMPGVWSARFSGPDATDARNNAKLLHELAMVFEPKERSAQFHCTLVVAAPNVESLVVEADWDGYIATIPKGENGFGYDPLFLVGETGRTAAELSLEEKNSLSHRAQALKALLEVFPSWKEQTIKHS